MKPLLTMVLFYLSAAIVFALPPIPHRVNGTVSAVDANQIEIAREHPGKDLPTVFVLKEGRTHFRKDGKKVTTERPAVGKVVTLYYRKEMGEWVATEVSWKSEPKPS